MLRAHDFGRYPIRRITSTVLLAVGIGLLLVAVGGYGWMSLEQRRLSAKWQAQNASTSPAGPRSIRATDDSITLLLIPKINVQAAILEGTSRRSLLLAPGHLQNTAWPGDPGNAVIAAHRDTFFQRLHELGIGDDIYVRRSGRKYRYVVSDKSIVSPNDMLVTEPTKDTRLTLITCYPTYYIGPASQRLVVVARLHSDQTSVAFVPDSNVRP